MKKQSFSLIELIFVLVVLALIVSVAVPKLNDTFDKTILVKIKTDIINTREKINQHKNQNILSNQSNPLESLDEVLSLKDTKQKGTWEKISDDKYKVYINSSTFVVFRYNEEKYTFECDFKKEYCKELTQ